MVTSQIEFGSVLQVADDAVQDRVNELQVIARCLNNVSHVTDLRVWGV